jgi:hypothetical protein
MKEKNIAHFKKGRKKSTQKVTQFKESQSMADAVR